MLPWHRVDDGVERVKEVMKLPFYNFCVDRIEFYLSIGAIFIRIGATVIEESAFELSLPWGFFRKHPAKRSGIFKLTYDVSSVTVSNITWLHSKPVLLQWGNKILLRFDQFSSLSDFCFDMNVLLWFCSGRCPIPLKGVLTFTNSMEERKKKIFDDRFVKNLIVR